MRYKGGLFRIIKGLNILKYLKSLRRGFSGTTTIKDTWTKPRGRAEAREGGGFGWAEGEGWGENADHCN